ncbi:MAG TPA: alpha-galactosidase [Enterococcus columbae]|nr:alpha-galactosidase [Enterococcus columbae]
MGIYIEESKQLFHLYNEQISYIFKVLANGQLGQLYFGKRVPEKVDYDYLIENYYRPSSAYVFEKEYNFSLEHLRQEYPSYGTSDFRAPAFEIIQENGSRISHFTYESYISYRGKQPLTGLPATYVEEEEEADSLEIRLIDTLTNISLTLSYTIFRDYPIITRNARFENKGNQNCQLTKAMSLSLDLPDANYEWVQFSGAWSRERHMKMHKLSQGIQAIGSTRGASGHMHNPFVMLKRPETTEFLGEVLGFSFVYSGNFIAQAEVDTYDVTRFTMGIHPQNFSWLLAPNTQFQTPEVVLAYSDQGMNGLSQSYHQLYRQRLARGYWRDKERPILLNNWEATYFDFDEARLLKIAKNAKAAGVELFVLDDGWFSTRCSETSGLGDWWANEQRLPNGIQGLSQKIENLGLKFGLWVELEMVNKDSELYRKHPDWLIQTPNRHASHGRNQYVLDFSRAEVVEAIYQMIAKILQESKVSYIKWDMNRNITECFSEAYPASQQGEIFHRYILGVYSLYERLIQHFPKILFESCASGGGRFDPGMLYYAPQAWTSDNTDAVERLKIQYGTSYVYPLSSMGAHISITPNHQVNRKTSLKFRGDVAFFGVFGYELDLACLSAEELVQVKEQIQFVKKYRSIFQKGTFYRLQSPFTHNTCAWMVVSEDKKQAIVGEYRVLNEVNAPYKRVYLQGLQPQWHYQVMEESGKSIGSFYGSELQQIGLITSDAASGQAMGNQVLPTDFWSNVYLLQAEE